MFQLRRKGIDGKNGVCTRAHACLCACGDGMRSREIYSVIAIGQSDLKYNFLPPALDIQTPRSSKCNEIVPEWATGRFLGCLLLY